MGWSQYMYFSGFMKNCVRKVNCWAPYSKHKTQAKFPQLSPNTPWPWGWTKLTKYRGMGKMALALLRLESQSWCLWLFLFQLSQFQLHSSMHLSFTPTRQPVTFQVVQPTIVRLSFIDKDKEAIYSTGTVAGVVGCVGSFWGTLCE